MGKRSTSIYDIAKLAGVSTATVSNVLNNKGSFSKKTRDLVLRIAREQGYVANFAAKSLRESRTRTIGLVTPDVSNDFFSSIVLGVEGHLRAHGYTSYICNTSNDRDLERSYVRDLISKQVDGLIYIGGASCEPIEVPADLPVVHIDHAGSANTSLEVFVGNNTATLVADMMETLYGHGCRRIACASVSVLLYASAQSELLDGYRAFLAAHDMSFDQSFVLEGPHRQKSYQEAERLVDEALAGGLAIDGIVAFGDRVALGVVNALKARGVAIGRDVRVIGMDDSIYARISSPAISTVRRHTDQMAEQAVNALVPLLAGERPAQTHIVIPHEVVERETTLG